MKTPLPKSLEVFLKRRASLVVADYLTAARSADKPRRETPSTTDKKPESPAQAQIAQNAQTPFLLLHIRYGLQVFQVNKDDGTISYVIELAPPKKLESVTQVDDDEPVTKVDDTTQHKHYRIFPDWQTSFFWKDPEYAADPQEDSVVDDDDVEAMYPEIATPFSEWRDLYEEAFEEQEIHLGSKAEVFPEAEERIAWCTEGFLMSCWLTLQDDVDTVQYRPEGKTYKLSKKSLSEEFLLFNKDMESLH